MTSYKFSVMVVEDEALIAKNIVNNINRASEHFHVIATASDGAQALELMESRIPDLVFTDIKMPVMDGLELLKEIDRMYPQIKTIVLSGYNEFEYAKTAIACKSSNYLLKPVNFEELKKALREIHQQLIAEMGELVGFEQISNMPIEEVVSSVKEYIDKNYTKPIDFTMIARNLGFSLAYLSKSFTKHVGESPTRYLINIRIMEAKKLLKTTDMTIKQISDTLGYADQFCFSKSFKTNTGLSPNKYRLNHSENLE